MQYKQPPTVTYIPPPIQEPKKDNNSMLGSIISAGSNIVGGVIDSLFQRKENQRNRQFQIAENEKNRQFTEDMYNKYESPQAQAQQMASAGLNPAAQGAVSTQSVGSASTGSIPAGQSPAIGASIAQAGQAIIQGQMMKAQLEKMNQETQGIYQDNLRKQFENSNAQAVYDMNMDTLRAELKLKQISYDEYFERVNILKLQYKQALAADKAGINPHVDAHNESVQRVLKLESEVRKINISAVDEHNMSAFTLSVLRARSPYELANLKFEYNSKRTVDAIGQLLDVDYYALPDYLKVEATILVDLILNTDTKSPQQLLALDNALGIFKTQRIEWETNMKNSSNPNYQSDLEQSRFLLDFINPLSGLFGN